MTTTPTPLEPLAGAAPAPAAPASAGAQADPACSPAPEGVIAAAEVEQAAGEELPRTVLHTAGNARTIALIVLTAIALLAVLRWAAAFFIPLMLGFIFYYALSPVVEAMARVRVPRAVGAALLIMTIWGAVGSGAYSLADDANALLNALPQAAQKLRDVVSPRGQEPATPLETVQKAAEELVRAAEQANGGTAPARGVQRVLIERPRFDIRDHLWTGTVGLVSLIGQMVLVTFLTYFLLLSGDTFRRKMVKIAGPRLAQKKVAVQALDEINAQIRRYLLVQVVASVGVGVATGLAFALLGLQHAAVWGVAAGVLNLVPYIGSILVTGGAALVAFMQFGTLNPALAVAGVSLLINTVEGNLLVPWLTSRASRMNPVAVFVGVLAWGWLWGVWGLLLGIPIMMVIKTVCDRIDQLKPVGELLGT